MDIFRKWEIFPKMLAHTAQGGRDADEGLEELTNWRSTTDRSTGTGSAQHTANEKLLYYLGFSEPPRLLIGKNIKDIAESYKVPDSRRVGECEATPGLASSGQAAQPNLKHSNFGLTFQYTICITCFW